MIFNAPLVDRAQLLGISAPRRLFIDLAIKPVTGSNSAEQIDLGRHRPPRSARFSADAAAFKSDFLSGIDEPRAHHHSGPEARAQSQRRHLRCFPSVGRVFLRETGGAIDGFISERGPGARSEMYDRTAFENAFFGSSQVPTRRRSSLPHFLALPALLDIQVSQRSCHARAESFAATYPVTIYELPYPHFASRLRSPLARTARGDASRTGCHETIRRATQTILRVPDAAPR